MITTVKIPIEQQKQNTLKRAGKTIYLGISTNILCIDDRLEPKYLSEGLMRQYQNISDFTATLYLGKIIFKKNKYGNLAPIYIPSQITESSFEGLNTFWLNEINPHSKKPFRSMKQCEMIMVGGPVCQPDEKSIPYQNVYYYRTKDNIVLNKEQIISYFTELHTLNTTCIKNYIDSINKNDGIRANILHDKLYDELLEEGILQKNMFEWYSDGRKAAFDEAKIIALDYLKTNNQYNFTIAFFDELFYVYLIASLKNFIFKYYDDSTMEYVDANKLIFNTGAYKKYISLFYSEPDGGYFYKNNERIYGYEVKLFMQNAESLWRYIDGFSFKSPNRVYRTYKGTNNINYDDKKPPIYAPSPLGNYYFEIGSNEGTFIEFFQRIYPSSKNPPKGWNKEMMNKLELKLE